MQNSSRDLISQTRHEYSDPVCSHWVSSVELGQRQDPHQPRLGNMWHCQPFRNHTIALTIVHLDREWRAGLQLVTSLLMIKQTLPWSGQPEGTNQTTTPPLTHVTVMFNTTHHWQAASLVSPQTRKGNTNVTKTTKLSKRAGSTPRDVKFNFHYNGLVVTTVAPRQNSELTVSRWTCFKNNVEWR